MYIVWLARPFHLTAEYVGLVRDLHPFPSLPFCISGGWMGWSSHPDCTVQRDYNGFINGIIIMYALPLGTLEPAVYNVGTHTCTVLFVYLLCIV